MKWGAVQHAICRKPHPNEVARAGASSKALGAAGEETSGAYRNATGMHYVKEVRYLEYRPACTIIKALGRYSTNQQRTLAQRTSLALCEPHGSHRANSARESIGLKSLISAASCICRASYLKPRPVAVDESAAIIASRVALPDTQGPNDATTKAKTSRVG